MKKFTATTMTMAVVSAILLTACSGTKDNTTTTAATTDASIEATTEAVTEATTKDLETTTNEVDVTTAEETTNEESEESREVSVSLRIEGISDTIFYEYITTDSENVLELLQNLDENNDDLTFTISDGYLSAVNEDTAGTYGGWDGWMYMVNGEIPMVGMGDYGINEYDDIVLFYGDPYGVGMQYPNITDDNLSEGILMVTSEDTSYDEVGNASVAIMPVVGATLTLSNDEVTKEYVTDENGKVTIDAELLISGASYQVTIEKVAENGCPLVLRLPSDYVLQID